MEHAVQLHLAGLSLQKTVIELEQCGVSRAKSTIHNWVHKADLDPRGGCAPDRVALNETVMKVNGEEYWFVAAVVPSTNRILHAGLYSHRNMAMTSSFLEEIDEKHEVRDAEFLVYGAPWLHAGLRELGVHVRQRTFGDQNPVERVFQEIKRRTSQFYNHFGNAEVETVEN